MFLISPQLQLSLFSWLEMSMEKALYTETTTIKELASSEANILETTRQYEDTLNSTGYMEDQLKEFRLQKPVVYHMPIATS